MSGTHLRFRQIHMDFHTSEQITGIGAQFDPEEYAATLARARVDSVTTFARCHHGWIYFDTRRFPERRHPQLCRNLLGEQIEACHRRGIRVPIYVTVQWDHFTAEQHPEWLCLGPEGQVQGTPPYQAGFYRKLCVNTPYAAWLKEHVQEILEALPVDGFFFDIVQPNDCSCARCRAEMLARGLDPSDGPSRQRFALPELGVELVGPAPYSPDFVVPGAGIGAGLPPVEHVLYLRGLEVRPGPGAQVLATTRVPYFERTWRHFCSHRHTPSSGQPGYPAVVRQGRCVYFAHPLFSQYAQNAPRWCRQLLLDAVGLLLPEPLLRVSGPSTLTAALNEQEAERRWVLHLLHYVPERRGQDFDVLEDVIPLHDLAISVRAPAVRRARCVPEGTDLPLTRRGERVEFVLPRLEGYQVVELSMD
ncbi:MAG: hypothetical protein AB1505_09425 [Candidatus Latescibacterota bacterium]